MQIPFNSDNQGPATEDNIQDQSIQSSEPKLAHSSMDTHAHELHKAPGHGFKHYVFEFLMIFFAVFCGFLAENQREHMVEREREVQYISSMLVDLGQDTISLAHAVAALDSNVKRLDTLLHLLTSRDIVNHGADLYYFARRASRGQPWVIHDATLQQLKNSGNFRLIRNVGAAKGIFDYYNQLGPMERVYSIELHEQQEYYQVVIAIFQPILLDKMVMPDNSITKLDGNPALMTNDSITLLHMAGLVSYLKSSRRSLMIAEANMNAAANQLIKMLQKEYHLN